MRAPAIVVAGRARVGPAQRVVKNGLHTAKDRPPCTEKVRPALELELQIFRTCAKTEGKDDSIGGIDVPYRIWHVDCVRANQSDV